MDNDKVAAGTIAKIDDDQQLVFGWASIIKDEEGRLLVDRQDDFIKEEGELEKAAYDYVLQSRDGGEMHIRKGVSTMVESVVLTKEKQEAMGITDQNVPVGWWIGFKVNDDRVWGEVKKGGYSGFSVHGKGKRTKKVLTDGSYTDVGKNDKGKIERPSPEEEVELKRHEKKYGKEHADLMRQAIRDGATMEQSHNIANRMSVSKEDCGCSDCSDQSVLVEKRFLGLLTKAQTASQKKIKTVMTEFKNGTLKSSDGKKVKSSRQAMAIALSEAGISKHKGVVHEDDGRLKRNKKKVKKGDFPGHPFRGNQHTGGIYENKSSAPPAQSKAKEYIKSSINGLDNQTDGNGVNTLANFLEDKILQTMPDKDTFSRDQETDFKFFDWDTEITLPEQGRKVKAKDVAEHFGLDWKKTEFSYGDIIIDGKYLGEIDHFSIKKGVFAGA